MPTKLSHFHDDQLLERVAQNSEDAFRELYERYQGTLLTKAVHFLGCENSAKDCLQDVFISIWVKRETLVIGNLNHYLHQAIRFRALRSLQFSRLVASLDKRQLWHTDQFHPCNALDYKELHHRFETRIHALPPDQRRVFLMHRDEGLSYTQIARRLGISVKTVEKKMSLALRSLREFRDGQDQGRSANRKRPAL